MYGAPINGGGRLSITRKGYLPHGSWLDPKNNAAEASVVELGLATTVHLQLRPIPGFDPRLVSIRLTKPTQGAKLGRQYLRWDTQGRIQFRNLKPGRFRAELSVGYIPTAKKVIEVEIPSSQTSGHILVPPIDLEGKVHIYRIRLRVPEGDSMPEAVGFWRSSASPMRGFGGEHPFRDGVLSIYGDGTPKDLVIEARGWQVARVNGVNGDRTVTLKRGHPVPFILDLEKPLRDGQSIGLQLKWTKTEIPSSPPSNEPLWYEMTFAKTRFEENNQATIRVHSPGEYKIEGELWSRELGYPIPIDLPLKSLVVTGMESPLQPIIIKVSAAALDDATKRMR